MTAIQDGAAVVLPEPRLRPAGPGDVESMAALINGYAALGLMLPKSQADLFRHLREFVVVADEEAGVVACGGLRLYSGELAEIVGLAVREGWQGRGLGGLVMERLMAEAEGLELRRVFAMTLEEGFFHRRGFRTTQREWIPEKVAADCRTCARRFGCREIAVCRDLVEVMAPPVIEGRRLRVVGQE